MADQSEIASVVGLLRGPMTLRPTADIIPGHVLDLLWNRLSTLDEQFALISRMNNCPIAIIVPTNSIWTGVGVRRLRDDEMLINLPVGLIVRLWVVYRLILSYDSATTRPGIPVIASLEDPVQEERPTPPGLRPLFRDTEDADRDCWWRQLADVDRAISRDVHAPLVADLMLTSIEVVLCHEFAHILRRHFDIVNIYNDVATSTSERALEEDARAQRAIEVDADYIAGFIAGVWRAHLRGEELRDTLKVLGFSVSGLLAVFDPKYLRVFDDFQHGSYYHPLVRRGTFFGGSREALSRVGAGEDCMNHLREGVGRFEVLTNGLEVDAMIGKYGEVDHSRGAPVINPMRPSVFQPTYDNDVDAAERDLEWVRAKVVSKHGESAIPMLG